MKQIIAILILFASSQALANEKIELKEGDTFIIPIHGEVHIDSYSYQGCPDGALCQPAQVVNMTYTGFGCLDRIETISKVVSNGDKVDIYVTALRVLNIHSIAAYCDALPTHTKSIVLGAGGSYDEENINVHFMGVPESQEADTTL